MNFLAKLFPESALVKEMRSRIESLEKECDSLRTANYNERVRADRAVDRLLAVNRTGPITPTTPPPELATSEEEFVDSKIEELVTKGGGPFDEIPKDEWDKQEGISKDGDASN